MDISYKDYRKDDIHGTVLYPAMMVAPVQKILLERIIQRDEIKSVFDPFHGSGTALFEAFQTDPAIILCGCDINPIANLITTVKLSGKPRFIEKDIERLRLFASQNENCPTFTFNKCEKWFRPDIAHSLSILRESIQQIKRRASRFFMWYFLCDTIRKYSNTRSSTYKLHTKTKEQISNLHNDVIDSYFKSIQKGLKKFSDSKANFKLYKGDILKVGAKFPKNRFDLTISSPPYGDNNTTVPYGQFSSLALQWIPASDLTLEGWEKGSYSSIDNMSLGGARENKKDRLTPYERTLIEKYLISISEHKQLKIINFFIDYFTSLELMCKYTKKYIVMTLGNRTVDGINIDLTDITSRFLEDHNFKQIGRETRNIVKKRIPRVTSRVNNAPIPSMNEEYVIIHQST